MRVRYSWRSILGSILISVGLVMILTFIWLVDLIGWRRLDQPQQIALFFDLVVACIFIVSGIRLSIIGVIEEFHIRSLPPYPMAIIPKSTSILHRPQFRLCPYCSKEIPLDSNFCSYCGVKQVPNSTVILKRQ